MEMDKERELAAKCRRLEKRIAELEYAAAEYFDRYHCASRLPAHDAAVARARAYAEFQRTVETKGYEDASA